jgi:lipooligosaccharide transport system permease protein
MRVAPPTVLGGRRAAKLVERNIVSYRRMWPMLVSGGFEPIFYLYSLGIGLGALVGTVPGPNGEPLSYAHFVAPGLLAASAMNGAILDATFGLFFKLKYAKTYEAIMATPLGVHDIAFGELSWSLMRSALYSGVFIIVMLLGGFITSWWGLLALPAAVLIAAAFSAAGMACTTWMRTWQDFDFVQLAILPQFLFSATFYPLSTYPKGLQIVVWLTPLFHGVNMMRQLVTGAVNWEIIVDCLYLAGIAWVGLRVVRRRLGLLLIT